MKQQVKNPLDEFDYFTNVMAQIVTSVQMLVN